MAEILPKARPEKEIVYNKQQARAWTPIFHADEITDGGVGLIWSLELVTFQGVQTNLTIHVAVLNLCLALTNSPPAVKSQETK